jgi:phosphoserine phosphatase
VRIHAYGDSSEDSRMLALAHERWFRGNPLK